MATFVLARARAQPTVRRMVDLLDEVDGWRRPKAARDRALLRLMWDLGLRRGELVEFDLEHVDIKGDRLSVLGKGRNERVWLDLPEETREALKLWLVHRGEEPGPLFCTVAKGGHVRLNRLSGTDVYRQIRPLGERVGARARPHGVRHSSITGVLEASGGDRRLAKTFARTATAGSPTATTTPARTWAARQPGSPPPYSDSPGGAVGLRPPASLGFPP